MLTTARFELRQLWELVLIPFTAVLLPWPLAFRWFSWLTRFALLYRPQTLTALAAAQGVMAVPDPDRWQHHFRLMQLIDHSDLYLCHWRSDRWLARYIMAQGDPWPADGKPFLGVTFHWGAGLWVFRHLRQHGVKAAWLFRSNDSSGPPAQRLQAWYRRRRVAEVERGGDSAAIPTGGAIRRLQETLESGRSVVALIDVPPAGPDRSLPVALLDRPAYLPRGLIRFAVANRIPVVGFIMGLDWRTGRRILMIRRNLPNQHEQALAGAIAQLLSEAITTDSAQWHFWPLIKAFFAPTSAAT